MERTGHAHRPFSEGEAQDAGAEERATCMYCFGKIHRPTPPGTSRNRNPWMLDTDPLVYASDILRTDDLPVEEMEALGRLYTGADESARIALLAAIWNGYRQESYKCFTERFVK